MNRMLPSLHRLWATAVLLLAALLHPVAAAADEPMREDWSSRADAVFNRVIPTALSVTTMAQDRSGWVWLGTQSGLGRWDGQRLRLYTADLMRTGVLPDSYVLALHVDADGTLWVGTSSGGLARYDAAGDRFSSPLAAGQALSRDSVHALLAEGSGRLWIGTGAGLDLLDTATGRLQPHAQGAALLGLPGRAVHALLRSGDGSLWVGTDQGLYRQAQAGAHFEPVALPTAEGASPHVAQLLQDARQRIWIGTRSHGAFLAAAGTAMARPLHQLLATPAPSLADAAIRAMLEARPDELWLGTDGEGILRIDTRRMTLQRIHHQARAPASLPDDDIFALMRDRDGLVWVASDTGVSHHAVDQRLVSTWFGGSGEPRSLSHPNVPALLALPDGRVWLATGDGGVDIVQAQEGRVARIGVDAATPLHALPPGRVLCMLREPAGTVLLGTQRGLYRADAAGRHVRRLAVPDRAPTDSVWALAWHEGRLWLGGLDGLWTLQPQPDGTLRVAGHAADTLDERRITALLPAAGGVLWVGTRSGLRRLDTASGAITRPAQDEAGRIGLPRGYIASMLIDTRGRLWVAAFGAGVRVLDAPSAGTTPPVHRISLAEGLPHNGVNAILADAAGHVWASTDGGLARIDRDSLAVRSFGTAEGVGVPNFWTGAGTASSGGALLFGGAGGLIIVQPWQLGAPAGPPRLAVSELRLGGLPPQGTYLPNDASSTLQVPPDQRHLLVEFAVLDYAAPARNRYQYRLRGVDTGWVDSDATRRVASYSHLPPGEHVLELRGARPQGPWSEPLTLRLQVLPRWHETRWLQLLLTGAALALLVALVQGRLLLLRRRQRVLEALVAERTTALEQRTVELQGSRSEMERLAYHDGLTGLPNRRCFHDALQRLVAQSQRGGPGFFLLLIDLDHFKQVNDAHGHATGDAVLVAVATCLQAALREGDLVARLGGDEFAALLPATGDDPATAAAAAAGRIFDRLATHAAPPGLPSLPGASIGAAAFPADATDADALYRAADAALYRAKNAGRNQFHHDPASEVPSASRIVVKPKSPAPQD